ncbi:hypothetical protein HW555_000557 [Spodoptera exigua]|uniref:TM7S3/TM198-like domain-containing protein n=1 Tax=Spodoptera exigua TaxID=7107 RepID=A0A835L8W2_SPOEX|nr:hypothetical protein HW555_000557 [Spodoptera exigua]
MHSLLGERLLLAILSLIYIFNPVAAQDGSITIPLNSSITYDNREIYGGFITMNGISRVTINFVDVNKNLTFIVFQAHSHINNISLYTSDKTQGEKNATGTNVGLVSSVNPINTFIVSNSNNNITVRVYISVHGYFKMDPIPGGCNMEYPIPVTPFLNVMTYSDYIFVDAAPPSVDPGCLNTLQANMSFYMMYLPEMNFYADVYFDGIRKMMSLKNIMKYGYRIPKSSWPETRRMLSAYPGTGAIYTVVATRVDNASLYSVYVPSYSYGCNDINDDGCEMIDDWLSQLLCATLMFVGVFICFFGHRFFKTEMFFAGFFTGVIITYILIALITVVDKPALLAAASISGVFFGGIWWLFWWLYGIPVLSVLLPSLNLGFLLASIFYYRLPGHQLFLELDFNFWSLFVLVVMLTALAVVSVSYAANILCCAVIGAFASVLAMDYYLGSNLKFIIINVIRRAVVPHFNKAILAPPLDWKDISMALVWVILASLGFFFQHWHNRGRPPFPPPTRLVRPSVAEPTMYGAIPNYFRRPEQQTGLGVGTPVARVQTERTSLLS